MSRFSLSIVVAVLCLFAVVPCSAADRVVHVYNWSDYIAEDTVADFEKATGIRVVYDVYDSNETLEAKLFAGRTGYDVVFPSAHPFAGRHIAAGLYAPLNKTLLPGMKNLDPAILALLAKSDPGNRHVVPYMWGTTGIGCNLGKVRELLGDDTPLDTLALLFDPAHAARLAAAGIALLDDEQEVLNAAMIYLGKNPNAAEPADIEAAADLLQQIRPYVKYFHSSQYINDLANGDICIALGYSGDVLQARDRAAEAGSGVEIGYAIPREGALMWVDVMAIPGDAPHPAEAHAFIDYLLRPGVIAAVSNYVAYANANLPATSLLDEEIRTDPGIYPAAAVRARLIVPLEITAGMQRLRTRTWTRIKTGH
ncbi:MAG: polyamine ABC transporter substrate-binding protein [Deltaproteobacteria bacterium]|nr:polyamine ABC transporter substrate-binding protein [Candidatus Anaeroferrophillacea bacterium]